MFVALCGTGERVSPVELDLTELLEARHCNMSSLVQLLANEDTADEEETQNAPMSKANLIPKDLASHIIKNLGEKTTTEATALTVEHILDADKKNGIETIIQTEDNHIADSDEEPGPRKRVRSNGKQDEPELKLEINNK